MYIYIHIHVYIYIYVYNSLPVCFKGLSVTLHSFAFSEDNAIVHDYEVSFRIHKNHLETVNIHTEALKTQ